MLEMKKGERKKKWNRLRLLNPKNLEKEVHIYGYNFSWKAHLLLILCVVVGIGAVGIVFKLEPVYFTIIIGLVLLMLPVFVLDMYKRMFEQKRFSDVATYAEQILYAFQKTGKAVSALRETREIFEAGQMREAIDESIAYLEAGRAASEKGVLKEALEIIEKPYSCTKIQTVHELISSTEMHGGEIEESVLLLLEDIELWKRRGYRLQEDKKKSHTDNILSIIMSVILCAVALYVLDAMRQLFPQAATDINIFHAPVIQFSSFVFIVTLVFVLMKSFRKLTVDWLRGEGLREERYVLDSYQMVVNYDEAKARKRSLLYAVPFLAGAVILLLSGLKWLGGAAVFAGAFMLFQHRVNYNLAKREVNNELYMALPQWLIEIALLLQNNNVQVSIVKSVDGAPAILRGELEALIKRIRRAPDKLNSYTDFCKDFDIPEMQSCMKMFHAMSESGTGNAKIQVNNLLHRVNEMQDIADRIRDENMAFKVKMIFSYPIIGASVKLLVDLAIGMVYMFQMLGNMGGM